MPQVRSGFLVGGLAASVVGTAALVLAPHAGYELLLVGILVGVIGLGAGAWQLRRSGLPLEFPAALTAAGAGIGMLWLGPFGWVLIGLAIVVLIAWFVRWRRAAALRRHPPR